MSGNSGSRLSSTAGRRIDHHDSMSCDPLRKSALRVDSGVVGPIGSAPPTWLHMMTLHHATSGHLRRVAAQDPTRRWQETRIARRPDENHDAIYAKSKVPIQ